MPSPCHCPRRILAWAAIALLVLSQRTTSSAEEPTQLALGGATAASPTALATADLPTALPPAGDLASGTSDHPLQKPLQMAVELRNHIQRSIQDYSCVLVKRERVNGRLREREYIFAKVRHQQEVSDEVIVPFGVYLRFLGPSDVKGREVLFVDGENDNRLIARNGGKRFAYVVTTLDPFGTSAMQGNRYPITEIGFLRLADRLIEVAQQNIEADGELRDCHVQYYDNSTIDGRTCNCIEVQYPTERPGLQFHLARVFIDHELHAPIRYEAYDWPSADESDPPLLEEYTYTRIQLNQGFAKTDFDRTNVAYRLK